MKAKQSHLQLEVIAKMICEEISIEKLTAVVIELRHLIALANHEGQMEAFATTTKAIDEKLIKMP